MSKSVNRNQYYGAGGGSGGSYTNLYDGPSPVNLYDDPRTNLILYGAGGGSDYGVGGSSGGSGSGYSLHYTEAQISKFSEDGAERFITDLKRRVERFELK